MNKADVDLIKQEISDAIPVIEARGIDTFLDFTKIFGNADLFQKIVRLIQNELLESSDDASNGYGCSYIIVPEARAFLLGGALSFYLGIPLLLARKNNKAPGDIVSAEYGTEYAIGESLSMQAIDLEEKKVLFLDDVYATGGTFEACKYLVEQAGGKMSKGLVLKDAPGFTSPENITVLLDVENIIEGE